MHALLSGLLHSVVKHVPAEQAEQVSLADGNNCAEAMQARG